MGHRRNLTGLIFVAVTVACSPESGRESQSPGSGALQNGSFTAQFDDARVHYEVHGSGPVLMVLPNSWGINIPPLRALYRNLESRLTMVYFDPRGMGESEPVKIDSDMSAATVRRDFDALRRHLGLARVNVIGWSNGATNLILLASEKPQAIFKVIFLHGSASFTEADSQESAERYPDLVDVYAGFLEDMQQTSLTEPERNAHLARFWLGNFFPAAAADPVAIRPKVEQMFKDCPFSWRHLSHNQREWSTFDFRDRLPLISAQSLVLAGAKDMIPVAKAEEMKQGLPGSRLVIFQNSGHFAPLEEPEAFQQEIMAWIGV